MTVSKIERTNLPSGVDDFLPRRRFRLRRSGLARFRCNVCLQRGTLAAAFRMIPINVKAVEELELPDTLLEFCDLPIGLVRWSQGRRGVANRPRWRR